MASRDHKIVRRAQALAELNRLSRALAERFNVELPDTRIANKETELAEIQRLESINGMLGQLLASGPSVRTSKKATKHGADG